MEETTVLADTVEGAENNNGRTVAFDDTALLVMDQCKIIMRSALPRRILASALAALVVLTIYGMESPIASTAIAIFTGLICFAVLSLIDVLSLKSKLKKHLLKVDVSRNEYKFSDKYVEYAGYENDELVAFKRVLYEEIISVKISDRLVNFIAGGTSYLIPRDKIPKGSDIVALLEGCKAHKARVREEKTPLPLKEALTPHEVLKSLLSISSTLALLATLFVMFSQIHYSEFFWISFILLVFPLSYFVVYIISKLKKVPTKRYATVIVIISTLILSVYPSLGAMIELTNRQNSEFVISVFDDYNSITESAIPTDGDTHYYTDSAYLEGINRWVDITVASSYINSDDKAAVNEFRAALTESEGWLPSSDMLILGDYERVIGKYEYYDKIKVFNATSGEYNKPISDDAATYYIATYEASSHCVTIYVFTVE
ncbi:MAG: hypothetical protein IJW03_03600 [Clostridia bacterium]|nr:hypothetical protein [Clostridia bacterium]